MLKKLRNKKTAKKIWIVLAALILPAFILWGSGSLIRSKEERASSGYAGAIFGRKVLFSELKDAVAAEKNHLAIQFGEDIPEKYKSLDFGYLAWQRLLLLAEAKNRKIKAGDKEVTDLIRRYPLFRKKGQFDNNLYYQMLEYALRTQPRVFEEQIREDLIISKLYAQVTDSLKLTEEEIRGAYRKNNEQISLSYITAQPSDFIKDFQPSEEEAKTYFLKNSLEFKQPVTFNLEYIAVETNPENEKLTRDKIKTLSPRLNKNTNLLKTSADLNSPLKETGPFKQTDPIPGIGWSPEILRLVSAAETGRFLPILYIDKRYYILRLKEKKEPYIPDFALVKEKAKEGFIKNKAEETAKEKIESCLTKLRQESQANPELADFAKTAQECGLKPGSTGLFKHGTYIEGIGASDNFWMAAGELKEGEFSQVIRQPSGFYIIKLKSKVPVDEAKFASEKTEFTQRLLYEKRLEYFNTFVKEIAKKAQLF